MSSRRIVSLLRKRGVWRCFSARRQDESIMNVFDRKAKRKQRNRAALTEDVAVYDYLKDEVIIDHFTVVARPMNGSEAAGDLVFIQTSLVFL